MQYSISSGLQLRARKKFLGNYNNLNHPEDKRTKLQVNFLISPMVTFNLWSQYYHYQELEPFYFGTANPVFCRYKSSITIGTTFNLAPRGTYSNITTTRNRTQQLALLSLNIQDFNFTMYDDYLSKITQIGQIGDNWDRFFTGGGFVRYRFSNAFTMHIFSEVYTGINRANPFLSPDVISYQYKYKKKFRKWVRKNFANEDPGQEYFNSSWFIVEGTYSANEGISAHGGAYLPSFDFFVGNSAPWSMFSQKFIHSLIHYDDSNNLRFHYFMHRTFVPGNLESSNLFGSSFAGLGLRSNFILP